MKKLLKVLCVIALAMAAGFAALYGFVWHEYHYYWEAEPKVEPVWEISYRIRELLNNRQELPTSLDELLATIEPGQLAKIKTYPMIWRPDSDPMFVIKINDKHGFQIDRGGSPSWLWKKEQVNNFFPP
ncbi:MAG: hypothetical protein ABL974_19935 [Prosthecobacter sp.]